MSLTPAARRRRVRAAAALTAAAVTLSLLTACGSGAEDTAAADDGQPVSITFWAGPRAPRTW